MMKNEAVVSVSADGITVSTSPVKAASVGTSGTVIQQITGELYQGEYEVSPGAEAQVLQVAGLTMEKDITIEPIPQHYGLISWNGSTLTVS